LAIKPFCWLDCYRDLDDKKESTRRGNRYQKEVNSSEGAERFKNVKWH